MISLEGNTTPTIEPYFLSLLGEHSMLSSVIIVTSVSDSSQSRVLSTVTYGISVADHLRCRQTTFYQNSRRLRSSRRSLPRCSSLLPRIPLDRLRYRRQGVCIRSSTRCFRWSRDSTRSTDHRCWYVFLPPLTSSEPSITRDLNRIRRCRYDNSIKSRIDHFDSFPPLVTHNLDRTSARCILPTSRSNRLPTRLRNVRNPSPFTRYRVVLHVMVGVEKDQEKGGQGG